MELPASECQTVQMYSSLHLICFRYHGINEYLSITCFIIKWAPNTHREEVIVIGPRVIVLFQWVLFSPSVSLRPRLSSLSEDAFRKLTRDDRWKKRVCRQGEVMEQHLVFISDRTQPFLIITRNLTCNTTSQIRRVGAVDGTSLRTNVWLVPLFALYTTFPSHFL